jgi:hypothetical protein
MGIEFGPGSLAGALGLLGVGVAMITPNNKWIGGLFVLTAVAVLFFDIHVNGWHISSAFPALRQRPWAVAGMIVFSIGFLVCAGWYFWPTASGRQETTDATETAFKLDLRGGNIFQPGRADMHHVAALALDVRIWNLGAPSAAIDWTLTVQLADGRRAKIGNTKIANEITSTETGSVLAYGKDNLDDKTGQSPVGRVPIQGTLLFIVDLPKAEIIQPETRLELSVKDVFGHVYNVTQRIGDWPQLSELPDTPMPANRIQNALPAAVHVENSAGSLIAPSGGINTVINNPVAKDTDGLYLNEKKVGIVIGVRIEEHAVTFEKANFTTTFEGGEILQYGNMLLSCAPLPKARPEINAAIINSAVFGLACKVVGRK